MIKSVSKSTPPKSSDYPWLGVAPNGNVVLFTSHSVGMIVHVPKGGLTKLHVGHFASDWAMDAFGEYYGEVVLSNV